MVRMYVCRPFRFETVSAACFARGLLLRRHFPCLVIGQACWTAAVEFEPGMLKAIHVVY
jgi:hypothetical protein